MQVFLSIEQHISAFFAGELRFNVCTVYRQHVGIVEAEPTTVLVNRTGNENVRLQLQKSSHKPCVKCRLRYCNVTHLPLELGGVDFSASLTAADPLTTLLVKRTIEQSGSKMK